MNSTNTHNDYLAGCANINICSCGRAITYHNLKWYYILRSSLMRWSLFVYTTGELIRGSQCWIWAKFCSELCLLNRFQRLNLNLLCFPNRIMFNTNKKKKYGKYLGPIKLDYFKIKLKYRGFSNILLTQHNKLNRENDGTLFYI